MSFILILYVTVEHFLGTVAICCLYQAPLPLMKENECKPLSYNLDYIMARVTTGVGDPEVLLSQCSAGCLNLGVVC